MSTYVTQPQTRECVHVSMNQQYPGPLCRCHGVIRFISWLHTERQVLVRDKPRALYPSGMWSTCWLLRSDHNRLVDALKLNVLAGARNFCGNNRTEQRYIFNCLWSQVEIMGTQRRCTREVMSIFTAFGLHNAPGQRKKRLTSLSHRDSHCATNKVRNFSHAEYLECNYGWVDAMLTGTSWQLEIMKFPSWERRNRSSLWCFLYILSFRNVKFVPNTATDTGVYFEANATVPRTFCGFASKLVS